MTCIRHDVQRPSRPNSSTHHFRLLSLRCPWNCPIARNTLMIPNCSSPLKRPPMSAHASWDTTVLIEYHDIYQVAKALLELRKISTYVIVHRSAK
ncbi:hypothetical protein PISMIDRAFT_271322 [Pisolithus microcarpus 441]|uniref:Uncharacterized protein n=1 Tax=Pisolithus microcarpus 441 TaxID=765257 RepID=A0A0C9ZAH8_9AGAM|nr:hypothetical protein PISMIDRAFT_271322 [Pisolithus microcarpus 441]